MPREVLLIADDFGMSPEINEAIIHTHRYGRLDGASLMMGQKGTNDAVKRAKENPSLQVGWHLHLNDSVPCTRKVWPWKRSSTLAGFAIGVLFSSRRLVEQEIRAQWTSFRATGLECRFVNAHHHLHIHPLVFRWLQQTLQFEFRGWIRCGRPRFFGGVSSKCLFGARLAALLTIPAQRRSLFPVSTTLWGLDRLFCMDPIEIRRIVSNLEDGLHEFVFHPRKINSDGDTACLLALADISF